MDRLDQSITPSGLPENTEEKFPTLKTQAHTHMLIISHNKTELSKPVGLVVILNKSVFTSGLWTVCFQ